MQEEKVVLKKYHTEAIYNYYKRQYHNYLLLIRKKRKYITYKVDSRIIAYLFQMDYVEELVFDQNLFMELLALKEKFHFNIAVVEYKKPREYYCVFYSDYLKLRNKSKVYIHERREKCGIS